MNRWNRVCAFVFVFLVILLLGVAGCQLRRTLNAPTPKVSTYLGMCEYSRVDVDDHTWAIFTTTGDSAMMVVKHHPDCACSGDKNER